LTIPVPVPNHTICNVCTVKIVDYDKHIQSGDHLSMARFQKDIYESMDELILKMGGKAGNKEGVQVYHKPE
jgi:hypothetical protein